MMLLLLLHAEAEAEERVPRAAGQSFEKSSRHP